MGSPPIARLRSRADRRAACALLCASTTLQISIWVVGVSIVSTIRPPEHLDHPEHPEHLEYQQICLQQQQICLRRTLSNTNTNDKESYHIRTTRRWHKIKKRKSIRMLWKMMHKD